MTFVKHCLVILGLLSTMQIHALTQPQVPFGVKVNGIENRYAVFGVFALPDQMLTVDLLDIDAASVKVDFNGNPIRPAGQSVRIRMPGDPGTHQLNIDAGDGERMRLNVFVMWAAPEPNQASLNGYRMGAYPSQPLKGLAIYEAPEAFVEVTPDNTDIPVSPNFTLGNFLCKQASGFPKYLIVRPELIQKLEVVLEELNAQDDQVTGLTVMSGFRTPGYNRSIGNGEFSRHVWGDAADVFVDTDGNGAMDDLNRDGKISKADSEWLAAFVDDLERKGRFGQWIGGIGIYDRTPSHGPFVHVDARGFKARW